MHCQDKKLHFMGAAASHWQFLRKMKGEGDFFFIHSTAALWQCYITIHYGVSECTNYV